MHLRHLSVKCLNMRMMSQGSHTACLLVCVCLRLCTAGNNPRGSIYITIMELGPQSHNKDGLSIPNSIMVVYMDPLGI